MFNGSAARRRYIASRMWALEVSPHHHLGVSRCATASRSLDLGAAGVSACRLVALAVPDPGHAIGSRPLIGPRMRPEAAGGPPTSGSLDCRLTQFYFGRAD